MWSPPKKALRILNGNSPFHLMENFIYKRKTVDGCVVIVFIFPEKVFTPLLQKSFDKLAEHLQDVIETKSGDLLKSGLPQVIDIVTKSNK